MVLKSFIKFGSKKLPLANTSHIDPFRQAIISRFAGNLLRIRRDISRGQMKHILLPAVAAIAMQVWSQQDNVKVKPNVQEVNSELSKIIANPALPREKRGVFDLWGEVQS